MAAESDCAGTVLVIDDEVDIVDYLATVLEEHGYRAVTATDANHGLESARRVRPDLITLDIMMPKKTGAALIKELDQDPALCRIPVLVVSAFSKSRDLPPQQFRAMLGARITEEHYIEKPIVVEEFIARVKHLMHNPDDANRPPAPGNNQGVIEMTQPGQKKIMIVDYNSKVREVLQSALEDAGFQVVGASDTTEALKIMADGRPDLISLDLVKSGIDGPKFIYQLRKDHANKAIPLLVMTSTSDEKDEAAAPEELMKSRILSGPGVYLKSPLTPGGYVKTIRDALNVSPSDVETLGEDLKKQLLEKLEGSDPETLKKVLSEL